MGTLLALPAIAFAQDGELVKGYCGNAPPLAWFQFSSSTVGAVHSQLLSLLTGRALAAYPDAVAQYLASAQAPGCVFQITAKPVVTYCSDPLNCAAQIDSTVQVTCGGIPSTPGNNTMVIERGGCLISAAEPAPEPCPIAPLMPVTDAAAREHESGTFERSPDMSSVNDAVRSGAACIVQKSAAAGASARITSGFRPRAYQAHLREVWDKWHAIRDSTSESCRVTKEQIRVEWSKHALVRQPVVDSAHSRGNAVDIGGVPRDSADAIGASCGMFRPEPVNDRVHFQPR